MIRDQRRQPSVQVIRSRGGYFEQRDGLNDALRRGRTGGTQHALGGTYLTTRTFLFVETRHFDRPIDGVFEAEPIDQSQFQRLPGGKHLAGGRLGQRVFLVGQLGPRFDYYFLKLVECLIDHGLQNLCSCSAISGVSLRVGLPIALNGPLATESSLISHFSASRRR